MGEESSSQDGSFGAISNGGTLLYGKDYTSPNNVVRFSIYVTDSKVLFFILNS